MKLLPRPHKGLWVTGAKEVAPGYFRRLKGVHPIQRGSMKSRNGSTLLYSLAAHSLFRFNDVRFQGVGGELYRNGVSIKTGLNGERLSFVRMPTKAGGQDYLFVAGGGSLFKVDTAGNVTNWGIAPPADGFTAVIATDLAKNISAFNTAATFTATSCTLADEATIINGSGNSMRMTVAASTLGLATGPVATADFDDEMEEKLIRVWVRIDDPQTVDYLTIQFDVGSGDFASDYYTFTVKRADQITPTQQSVDQVRGIASLSNLHEAEDSVVDANGLLSLPSEVVNSHAAMAQITFPTTPNTWTQLRIPKTLFLRSGTNGNDWDNVANLRLSVKTNSKGQAIVYWDTMTLQGRFGLVGRYRYRITYKNSASDSRSNANPTPVEVSGLERKSVDLASVPASGDAQVDTVEFWRTVGDGVRYFLLDSQVDTDPTYTDQIPDFKGMDSLATETLGSEELPTDNTVPNATFFDAAGPFNAAMFWIDSAAGNRGYVYHSPIGRPEGMKSFIRLSGDDDPTQKIFLWNGDLYVITESHFHKIFGTDPYVAKELSEVPGTTLPDSVVVTAFGVFYEAADGIRVFDGMSSRLVAFESVGVLFRGETSEGITWNGTITATFARGEYIFSDGTTTLALNVQDGTWRNLGVGCTALFYEEDSHELIGSFGGKVVILEDEGVVTDAGSGIAFELEPVSVNTGTEREAVINRIDIDINTANQALALTLLLDGVEVMLPNIITSSRQVVEIPVGRYGQLIGVRLGGTLTQPIEIFDIDAVIV